MVLKVHLPPTGGEVTFSTTFVVPRTCCFGESEDSPEEVTDTSVRPNDIELYVDTRDESISNRATSTGVIFSTTPEPFITGEEEP